jgi:hypothetical protein
LDEVDALALMEMSEWIRVTELATRDVWYQRDGETLWELPEGGVVIRDEVVGSDIIVATADASFADDDAAPLDAVIAGSAGAAFDENLAAELAAIRNDVADGSGVDILVERVPEASMDTLSEEVVLAAAPIEVSTTEKAAVDVPLAQEPAISVEAEAGNTLPPLPPLADSSSDDAKSDVAFSSIAADVISQFVHSGIALLDVPDDVLALVSAMLSERDACALAACTHAAPPRTFACCARMSSAVILR